ncbi:MAG: hypothetical protein A4E55_00372 [Pelotomaculum sp. PtaU1.Bin035]|nr:MAG: hypothetical protein A4E55_00372 [Pelotomaculum sp. PtaU1.Bin035]
MSDQNIHVKVLNPDGMTPAEVHFRTGQLPTPFQYQGYSYTLDSIQSVIDLILWKGSKENTVIFVNENEVQVILDNTITSRPKDTARYSYKKSLELEEWGQILGKAIPQKSLIDFLKRLPEDQLDEQAPLLAAVQKLNLATVITGDYDYEDVNNHVVAFKIKEAEGSTQLPKVLIVHMPLIYGSENVLDMEVELEFRAPRNEGEKPVFLLSMPKFDRYWQEAVEHEVGVLKEALAAHLILDGRGLK